MPATAERIVDCAEGNKKCLLPICPICARHYRRFFISEVLQIYTKSPNGAQTATVYLDTYKAGALSNASLRTAHDRFRKQLERSDFGGAVVIGGTEVTYRPELNDWLLHLHLLFLGASEQAWQNLEKCSWRITRPRSVAPQADQQPRRSIILSTEISHLLPRGDTQWKKPGSALPSQKTPALRIGVLGMPT